MNKGKKKPGAGWIILGILSGYYTLANLDGVQRVYSFHDSYDSYHEVQGMLP